MGLVNLAKETVAVGGSGDVKLGGAVNGYYTLIAMIQNVARTQLPAGATPQVKPFPQ